MDEFHKSVDRFVGLIIGLIILYAFLTSILRVDRGTYLSIAHDILKSYVVKWW